VAQPLGQACGPSKPAAAMTAYTARPAVSCVAPGADAGQSSGWSGSAMRQRAWAGFTEKCLSGRPIRGGSSAGNIGLPCGVGWEA
jgi:hypothetical protein